MSTEYTFVISCRGRKLDPLVLKRASEIYFTTYGEDSGDTLPHNAYETWLDFADRDEAEHVRRQVAERLEHLQVNVGRVYAKHSD